MTQKEIDDLKKAATSKHNGDVTAAACDFLGILADYKKQKKIPTGYEASVLSIVSEVETYK